MIELRNSAAVSTQCERRVRVTDHSSSLRLGAELIGLHCLYAMTILFSAAEAQVSAGVGALVVLALLVSVSLKVSMAILSPVAVSMR